MNAHDNTFVAEGNVISSANEEEIENTLARMLDPLFTDIFRSWGRGDHSNLLEKIKKLLVRKALAETRGNQIQAAKLLGISRNILRHRIDKTTYRHKKTRPCVGQAVVGDRKTRVHVISS
jgi:DNA-binding protein Fis